MLRRHNRERWACGSCSASLNDRKERKQNREQENAKIPDMIGVTSTTMLYALIRFFSLANDSRRASQGYIEE